MSKDGYGDGNSYRGVICKGSEIKTFFFDDKDEDKMGTHLDINDLVSGHPEAAEELEYNLRIQEVKTNGVNRAKQEEYNER